FSGALPTATPPDPAAAADIARLRAQKQSVLDRALDEFKRISALVDGGDKQRLEAHMDSIREVERSLANPVSGAAGASCRKPDPMAGPDFITAGKAQM